MRSNLVKLYVSNFLTGCVLWYAIEKLFMLSIGIDALGVAANAIVYMLITTLLDVPSGVLADRWSRKYTLLLGIGCLAVASLFLGFSNSLVWYMMGTILWGLYAVLTSGTYQALTYDSLKEIGREKEYATHQGRSYGLFMFAVAPASIVGGYVAEHYGYPAAYFWTLLPCAANMLVILSMREPRVHEEIENHRLWQHIRQAYQVIGRQRLLLFMSVLFVGMWILSGTQMEYPGLYFIALGAGAVGSGYANAALMVASGAGHFWAGQLARYMKYILPLIFVTFCAFSVWRSSWGLGLFLVTAFLQAIVLIDIENTIQQHTTSRLRATTISLLTFASSVVAVPVNVAFGSIARSFDIFYAYQFVAVIGLVFAAVWYFRPRSARGKIAFSVQAPDSTS